jgi:two-component system, NarL family, nitrate/nitrite response regulator NarL
MSIKVANVLENGAKSEQSHSKASSPSRLIIADDHELLRESMRYMLHLEPDLRVIDEAKDGQEAIELCRLHHLDLVLMDVSMPKVNGLEATKAIKEELPATKVLLVSAEHLFVSEAVRAGVEGYVSNLGPVEELMEAIRGVLQGESQHSLSSRERPRVRLS